MVDHACVVGRCTLYARACLFACIGDRHGSRTGPLDPALCLIPHFSHPPGPMDTSKVTRLCPHLARSFSPASIKDSSLIGAPAHASCLRSGSLISSRQTDIAEPQQGHDGVR